jgi:transcriptional accessory protein Tex/SPT6
MAKKVIHKCQHQVTLNFYRALSDSRREEGKKELIEVVKRRLEKQVLVDPASFHHVDHVAYVTFRKL